MITTKPTSASSIVVIETVSNVVNADLSPCSPNLTASSVCECADTVDKGIVAMEPTPSLHKGHIDASADHIATVRMPSSDPALWNLQNSNEKSTIIRNGPTIYQNANGKLLKSRRQYMSFNNKTQKSVIVSRCLSKAVFTRQLHNGEMVDRDRLLYSASKGSVAVYCFPCRLFSKKKRTFASNGFNG